jgi:hypothetical protein
MTRVLKDFLMGSTIVLVGMILSLAAAVALFFLWLFFHLVGIFAWFFFFVFLFFLGLWLIGFLYRKAKEMTKK